MSQKELKNNALILSSFKNFITVDSKLMTQVDFESVIDETIASYIINTIKQFYEDYENHKVWLNKDEAVTRSFDIENFIDIIDAYLVGFNQLKSSSILTWLIKLKQEIDIENSAQQTPSDLDSARSNPSLLLDESSNSQESSKTEKTTIVDECIGDIKLLMEMFPQLGFKEISKVYKKRKCDYTQTIDELILLQEAFELKSDDNEISNEEILNEEERKELKERTVQK